MKLLYTVYYVVTITGSIVDVCVVRSAVYVVVESWKNPNNFTALLLFFQKNNNQLLLLLVLIIMRILLAILGI